MLTTVEGTYQDGAVRLDEPVRETDGSKVLVIFLPSPTEPPAGESVSVARADNSPLLS